MKHVTFNNNVQVKYFDKDDIIKKKNIWTKGKYLLYIFMMYFIIRIFM